MRSECCLCDRTAASFWGARAYCREHLREIQKTEPPGSHRVCTSCSRWKTDTVHCPCGQTLCPTCYDRGHQAHLT